MVQEVRWFPLILLYVRGARSQCCRYAKMLPHCPRCILDLAKSRIDPARERTAMHTRLVAVVGYFVVSEEVPCNRTFTALLFSLNLSKFGKLRLFNLYEAQCLGLSGKHTIQFIKFLSYALLQPL